MRETSVPYNLAVGKMVLCQGLNQLVVSLIHLMQSLWECTRIIQVVGVRKSALVMGRWGL